MKNSALERLHRQKFLKEYCALQLLDQCCLFTKKWLIEISMEIQNF